MKGDLGLAIRNKETLKKRLSFVNGIMATAEFLCEKTGSDKAAKELLEGEMPIWAKKIWEDTGENPKEFRKIALKLLKNEEKT